ncbi:MAG TPA: molybdopterin cofactor-binding domain-containing protein [Burkholderiales bacterium]|nr:molybdopterin cofactor-binding domain-containing protein [Burkholderiales bacterium]
MNRRQFLQTGGALVVSFSIPARAQKLPGALDRSPQLDSWIRIGADGGITVFTGKAELGQGVKTALLQIAAEQLQVDMQAIKLVTADTALTPNEGYTAGSNSMKDSGTAILNAAAQAREILLAEASKRLGAPVTAQNGEAVTADGRRISYGQLVEGKLLSVRAAPESKLSGARRFVGKSIQRVDIPAKVTGGVAYVHDLRLPGMVHARVVRPPSYGAELKSVNTEAAAEMPGVIKIVRDGNFLAVVAGREWEAVQALRALRAGCTWTEQAKLPRDVYATLAAAPTQDIVIADAPPVSGKVIEAAYTRPYQLHAAIGPSCAVARYESAGLTIWSHAQGMFPLRGAVAELVGLPAERVHCIHLEGSGCYGHNGADDVAGDAALIARALPGKPVRVQWMREDEHAWEPYGPAMLTKVRATLDGSGNVSAWQYEVLSNTHSTRPGKAGDLLAGRYVEKPFQPSPPRPLPQPEGGGDRNAIPLYRFPSRVTNRFIPEMPLRVSALRGLGAYMNIFSIESFIDELAQAARVDPVEYRLRQLEDPRAREVIKLAAERFGWNAYKKENAPQNGHGRGFAFARYKNLAAYVAIAMEVDVERETGDVRVKRVVAAVDSGEAINPDGIKNQIEGGILQSISWTTFESAMFNDTRITSRDWSSYPILRFSHVPTSVEAHVIDRPGEHFLGTGEAAQGPTAGALANAIAHATGVRIRDLPLNRARLKQVLAA